MKNHRAFLTKILTTCAWIVLAGCNPIYHDSTAGKADVVTTPTPTTTLNSSVSSLALSVNCSVSSSCTVRNAALTGHARQFTITNSGTADAEQVSINYSSTSVPSGTTITSTCSGALSAGSSCTITVTPGTAATEFCGLNGSTSAPSPTTISISSSNASTVQVGFYVLSYGCVFQSGALYSIDDTTSSAGSIGGKVLSLTDSYAPLYWSTDSSNVPLLSTIAGTDETSTAGVGSCNALTDGSCNTALIQTFYTTPNTTPSLNLDNYAAGVCKASIVGSYSDWYLPAVCEIGVDSSGAGVGCGTSSTPTVQNVATNIVDYNMQVLGVSNSEVYWTSTTNSAGTGSIWVQNFSTGNAAQLSSTMAHVRCARSLTY